MLCAFLDTIVSQWLHPELNILKKEYKNTINKKMKEKEYSGKCYSKIDSLVI